MTDCFVVKAFGAALEWGRLYAKECVAVGIRKYTARLYNIVGSWETACAKQSNTIKGQYFNKPNTCTSYGVRGMWATWRVKDDYCTPNWGSFRASSNCLSNKNGYRKYSSILWNIKDIEWATACYNTQAIIFGRSFYGADNCVNTGYQWGEFHVSDMTCIQVRNCRNRNAFFQRKKRRLITSVFAYNVICTALV